MSTDPGEVANHTIEWMKRISAKLDVMGLDLTDLKSRVSTVEDIAATTSHRLAGIEVQMTNLIKRMDRFDGHMQRIERRLDLNDGRDGG